MACFEKLVKNRQSKHVMKTHYKESNMRQLFPSFSTMQHKVAAPSAVPV